MGGAAGTIGTGGSAADDASSTAIGGAVGSVLLPHPAQDPALGNNCRQLEHKETLSRSRVSEGIN